MANKICMYVPNVTAHPSMASVPTSYYSMWHYNYRCPLKGYIKLLEPVPACGSTSEQEAQLSLTNRGLLVCKVVEVWQDFLSEYVWGTRSSRTYATDG